MEATHKAASIEIREPVLMLLEEQLAPINKRAEKHGFNPVRLVSTVIERKPGQAALLRVDIQADNTCISGYSPIAIGEYDGDAIAIWQTFPGESVPAEIRNDAVRCDHCGYIRRRNKAVLIRHDATSEYKLIGMQCIKDFIPQSAQYITYLAQVLDAVRENEDEAMALCEDEGFGGYGVGTGWISLNQFLSLSAAAIREHGWLSRGKAYDDLGGNPATADRVWNAIWDKESRLRPSEDDRETASKVIEYFEAGKVQGDSTYIHNLNTIYERGFVTYKTSGYAASMLPLYDREVAKEQQSKAAPVSNHVGAIGERLRSMELSVVNIKEFGAAFSYSKYDNGLRAVVKMQDSQGNVFTWFTNADKAPQIDNYGDKVKVTGTVKNHDEYNGVLQTVLTRCKVEVL